MRLVASRFLIHALYFPLVNENVALIISFALPTLTERRLELIAF